MEAEILGTLGSGAGGGLVGALIAYLGIKARLDSMEKTLLSMVSQRECAAVSAGLSQRVNNAADRFSRIDANIEVLRQILVHQNMVAKQRHTADEDG